jgi:hypothetical protein
MLEQRGAMLPAVGGTLHLSAKFQDRAGTALHGLSWVCRAVW